MYPRGTVTFLWRLFFLALVSHHLTGMAGTDPKWRLTSAKGVPVAHAILSPEGTVGRGFVEVLENEWVFVSVNATISISWPKDANNVDVDSSDIYLLDENEKKYETYGSCLATGLHYWRDDDFKVSKDEKPRSATQDFVFAVPKGVKKLTFCMKDQKKPLVVARTQKLKVLNVLRVSVKSKKVVQAVDFERDENGVKIGGQVVNPEGGILQLKLTISWKRPHKKGQRQNISVEDKYFSLLTDTGAWCPSYGKLETDGQYDWGWSDSTSERKPLTITYYFPISKSAKSATLYVGTEPITKVSLR